MEPVINTMIVSSAARHGFQTITSVYVLLQLQLLKRALAAVPLMKNRTPPRADEAREPRPPRIGMESRAPIAVDPGVYKVVCKEGPPLGSQI